MPGHPKGRGQHERRPGPVVKDLAGRDEGLEFYSGVTEKPSVCN